MLDNLPCANIMYRQVVVIGTVTQQLKALTLLLGHLDSDPQYAMYCDTPPPMPQPPSSRVRSRGMGVGALPPAFVQQQLAGEVMGGGMNNAWYERRVVCGLFPFVWACIQDTTRSLKIKDIPPPSPTNRVGLITSPHCKRSSTHIHGGSIQHPRWSPRHTPPFLTFPTTHGCVIVQPHSADPFNARWGWGWGT